jgi:pimeloyl-ACP methyl ester carboxylesterase
VELFFRKSGEGRPLVILHGLFGISDNWAALAKLWSAHFTVYTLDLRNHGQSPHSDEWNYRVMADDVVEFFGTERLNDVILLGHSMGGKTAMRLALDYPMALSKLIVSDIAPKRYDLQQHQVIEAIKAVDVKKLDSRKDAEVILQQHLHDNGTIQFLSKNLFWRDQPDGTKILDWRFNARVIAEQIENISEATSADDPCEVDTLFIRGGRSHYITAEDELLIQQQFPNSSIVTIPDAGHWVHADQPQLMFTSVLEFSQR